MDKFFYMDSINLSETFGKNSKNSKWLFIGFSDFLFLWKNEY
jgi:hypothetical protein